VTPKTTLTARVSPDTLAGIDSAAQAAGVNRSQLVDRILADWMQAQNEAGRQRWANVHDLLDLANDAVTQVDNGYAPASQLHAALRMVIRAVSALNDA